MALPPKTWRALFAQYPNIPADKLRWWLSDVLACSLTALPLDEVPDPKLSARFEDAVRRLERNEPVQYICGKAPFMDFEVLVTPDVLIPRPETEQLVDRILQQSPSSPMRVLDVGTGSGCIALALKRARPKWEVTGIDVSENALALARKNAEALGAAVLFERGNLLEGHPPGSADLIVANLPYISEEEREALPAEVRDHEPGLALFAEDRGTALVLQLMEQALTVLKPEGKVYLETGENQTNDYHRAAHPLGWNIETVRDLAGRERFHVLSRSQPTT
jgi:release factor glutamine methyltransferase